MHQQEDEQEAESLGVPMAIPRWDRDAKTHASLEALCSAFYNSNTS